MSEGASDEPTEETPGEQEESSDEHQEPTGEHEEPTDASSDDATWRERLTDEEYQILREGDTERPYTGEHVDRFEDGTYQCAGCGAVLFDGDTKFDAHCGWPSFWEAVDEDAVERRPDHSQGMERTEVVCANCGGHLGHVFEDGPEPTGERFCINSAALDFEPGDADEE